MNVQQIAASIRPKLRKGPVPALTPLQEIELYAWYLAKKELGSYKTKAHELGVTKSAIQGYIERMKLRVVR